MFCNILLRMSYLQLFFMGTAFLITVPTESVLLEFMSSDDMKRYFDISTTDEVPEYEIVSPYIYEENGRKRRDLEIEQEIKEIKLEAFGEQYHMRLKENRHLIADGLEIEQHNANGTTNRIPLKSRRCFYIGQLVSHNISRVAVSTCKGMSGIIGMEQQNLYIRPLNDKHAEEYRRRRRDIENPHIIYRRSVAEDMPDDSHFCGLDPDYDKNATFYHDAVKNSRNKESFVGKENTQHAINKRACPVKYLEVRLMVDLDMVNYHGQDLIDYTLTLMNIVAARFAEPSLGTLLNIHIAKLETLTTNTFTDQSGNTLFVSAVGETTLENLANFQRVTYIPDERDPNHWDLAVMITRKNLLHGGRDSLLGVAFNEGTCDPIYGAGLAQDSGLSSGQIIAHEIGHTLGMDHDGSGINARCPDQVNVMSSSRPVGAGAFKWSSCSQANFNTFLSNPGSACLNDVPPTLSAHAINSGSLPGYQLITADEQCRLLSNDYSGWCESSNELQNICQRLTCLRYDNRCFYQVPAAEGTVCGPGMWCISGECVASQGQFPTPVNGGWSAWAPSSQCSRTCGGGIRIRERCCDNPTPRNGGSLCQGKSAEIELCNRQSCTKSQPEFAHEQCAATNNEPWRGGFYTWEAYFDQQTEQELCAFKCLNNINWVVPRGPSFQDGTRCSVDGKNELKKCLHGNCVEFGCDGKLDSTMRYDKCLVCGGDGSSCAPVTGFYNAGTPYVRTAFENIPAGATSVEITNTTPLTSFMAMKVMNTGQYIFGNGNQPVSGEYYYNGIFTKYFYEIESEIIFIEGPTPAAFTVEVFRANSQQRPTITYTYYTPRDTIVPTQAPNYWMITEGQCSVTCGTGTRQQIAQCISPLTGSVISESLCNPATRPTTSQIPCFPAACPTTGPSNYWMISEGTCSVTCGYGVKQQTARCFSPSLNTIVDDSQCEPGEKPNTAPQSCFIIECPNPNYWVPSEGPCSATCGFGVSVKSSRCFSPSTDSIVSDALCDASTRPADSQQTCYLAVCPAVWIAFPFGECDATCGEAYQRRTVWCATPNGESYSQVSDSQCAGQQKPEETLPCDVPSCGVWDVGPLSECSVTCGDGIQVRSVVCRPKGFESYPNPPTLSESQCRASKPPSQLPCNLGECPSVPTEHRWIQAGYGECTATCGSGTRTREIVCVATGGTSFAIVDKEFCAGLQQPPAVEPCDLPECESVGVWQTLDYTECSTTCGEGIQIRPVVCRPEGYESLSNPPILPDSQCRQEKPQSQRPCNIKDCPATTPETPTEYLWLPFNWEQCTGTCGNAIRTRNVWCVINNGVNYVRAPNENLCSGLARPHDTEPCDVPACPGDVTDPPSSTNPDQGTICAGLFEHAFNGLNRISSTTNGQFCNETIVAHIGQKIRLLFHRCNIQCDEGDEGAIRDNHRRFKLCCKEDTFEWTSVSNIVQLEHKTRTSGHGYEVSVEFLNNAVSPGAGCDKILTSASGAVSSPSFPSAYHDGQECLTTIVGPPGKKIQLDFESFDLLSDAPWAPNYCFHPSDDNIEIYDLNTNTGTRYCGKYNDASELRTSPLNDKVLIKFKSNGDGRTSNGFHLNYHIVDA